MSTQFPTRQVLLALVACALLTPAQRALAEWGNLKGRFVVEGEVPAPRVIRIFKEEEICKPGGKDALTQDVLVDAETGGLANVVVYLVAPLQTEVPIHPDYVNRAGDVVEMRREACEFHPRITTLWTRQKLRIVNRDEIQHSVKATMLRNRPFHRAQAGGDEVELEFDQEELLPAQLDCGIHLWARGWLVVRNTPYMAVTDREGRFEIKDVPAGEWEFAFWHEKLGYVQKVTADDQEQFWKRGRQKFTIAPEGVDLGDVKIPAASFER